MSKTFNEYGIAFDNVCIKVISDASQFRNRLLCVDAASPAVSAS